MNYRFAQQRQNYIGYKSVCCKGVPICTRSVGRH
jgi:hypothetical protein